MKTRPIQRKLLTILLALCMVLSLVPMVTLAAPSAASDTADFTVQGGTPAIDLLNQYRTGTGISSWDNSSKTLTLRGIDFTTTAQTAVKLPAGSTVVLADGSVNAIRSGDVSINASGTYKNQTFISALDAAGSLTIQGGPAGTGSLEVLAGNVNNSGNSWTYSSGITVDGDFTVKGGHVTARGGSVESRDTCFSIGVNMDSDTRNKALLVTGGTLTAIAGEAYELQEDGTKREVFSRGVYMYRGSVSLSGSGKLTAQSVPAMVEGGILSNGLYISVGDLLVAGAGEVEASGAYGVYISGGGIRLDGGKLTAASTQAADAYGNLGSAVDVDASSGAVTSNAGNITVNGGTLETVNGKIYMSSYGTAETQGLFTVTGGAVMNEGALYGAKKLLISGGTVQTQQVSAKELSLSGGSLTIREPVRKNPYSGNLYALPAVDVRALAVSGGTLDVAWEWGEYTPIVLPKDEEYNDVGILVRMPYDTDTASFTGGTSTLDTGFAGNTALLLQGQLTLCDGMAETGADASHRQTGSDPVKFAAVVVTPPEIEVVEINHVTVSFKDGDKPVFTGSVSENAAYAFRCEWWSLDSDTGILSTEPEWGGDIYKNKITAFEAGKTYHYGVYVTAYTADISPDAKLKINGREVEYTRIGDENDTQSFWIETNLTMTPMSDPAKKEIPVVEINNATLTFKDGDKPVFTGTTPNDAPYVLVFEEWRTDGEWTRSDEWFNDADHHGNDKDITAFDKNKSYNYTFYIKTNLKAYEEGWCFGQNTKLKINGKEVSFTRDVSDSEYHFSGTTGITMTPTADGHTHSYGKAWIYDSANHWHECSCGDKSDTAAHSFKWIIDKEATATEKGSKHEECTVCGAKRSENTVIDKLPGSGSTGNTGSGDNNSHKPGKNDSGNSPQTGDNSSVLWLAILCISGVLGVLGFAGKKKMP